MVFSPPAQSCCCFCSPLATIAPQRLRPLLEASSSSLSQLTTQLASAAASPMASSPSFSSPSSPAAASMLAASDPTQSPDPGGTDLAPLTVTSAPTPSFASAAMPPPFLMKTYELVDDASTDDVISWNNEGNGFVIWSPAHLCQQLLRRYFKHSNFSSFVRQLNTYGFRKVSLERWEFGNDDFQRGKKHLLSGIHRRRSSGVARPLTSLLFAEDYAHTLTMLPSCSVVDTSASGVEDEIERLKKDKVILNKEVVRLQQQLDITMGNLHTMWERLRTAEASQKHMLKFVYKALNRPGFLAQFSQQSSTGTASENRGPMDVDESTSSSAVGEHFHEAAAAGLLPSNDIVNPHRQQRVSVQGGVQAEMSTQAESKWDEVQLVDAPSRTLDELVEDAKLMRSASLNKNAEGYPYVGSFMAAENSWLLQSVLPQSSNESSGGVQGSAATCTGWAPAVGATRREQPTAPHLGHNLQGFVHVSPLRSSDQRCEQTTYLSKAAEHFYEHGVDGISSMRSPAPGMLRADAPRESLMSPACSAASSHQYGLQNAADDYPLRQHMYPMARDRYGYSNVASTFTAQGVAIDCFHNAPIGTSGRLENSLFGAPEMSTAPQQQEEQCPVVREEGQSSPDYQKGN